MPAEKKSESKVLDRAYVEMLFEGKSGKITRTEAITEVARDLGVAVENVGLVAMHSSAGTTDTVGRFYVYGSPKGKMRLHPQHLGERTLTKEEREKLKQERKKAATAPPAPEAKK